MLLITKPLSQVRAAFAKSQLVIWAVEGLSNLISASVFEDRFGVVQKQLPKILAAMLNLQQTVERHKVVLLVMHQDQQASNLII